MGATLESRGLSQRSWLSINRTFSRTGIGLGNPTELRFCNLRTVKVRSGRLRGFMGNRVSDFLAEFKKPNKNRPNLNRSGGVIGRVQGTHAARSPHRSMKFPWKAF